MVGRRCKDRVEIERRNAQGLQIIELFNDAIEIAALIPLLGGGVPHGLKVMPLGWRGCVLRAKRSCKI